MKSIKNRTVIVLGLGPSGLFLVRQIHKLTTKIYAIGRPDDVGMYSKYIDKNRRYYVPNFEGLMSAIKDVSTKAKEKPLLLISSDQYLTQLLSNNVNWSECVDLFGSDISTLRLINDKQRIVEFCESNNLMIPRSYTFVEFKALKEQPYPVIIKPNEKQLNPVKNPIGKIRLCRNSDDFNSLLTEMVNSSSDLNDFHIQNYIEGNNAQQYSVGGFYSEGKPLAEVVVNQIKQYPQGISAMVITTGDDNSKQVQSIAHVIVDKMSYSGFLEVEFKIDKNSNKAYILDVNPRPWGWVSVLGRAFKNFHVVFDNNAIKTPPLPVLWQSKLRRLMAFRNHNNANIKNDKTKFLKAYDIFDSNDMKPSFMIYVMALRKLLKK